MNNEMPHSRKRFGRLFYVTIASASVVTVAALVWQPVSVQLMAWRLTRQLRDPVGATRRGAADELVRLGPTSTYWVARAMRDPDSKVRVDACSILLQTTPDDPGAALAAVLAAAKDSDPAVRAAAVAQLEKFISRYGSRVAPSATDQAILGLCDLLDDESAPVRRAVLTSFFTIGPRAKAVVRELDKSLNDTDKSLRVAAAEAMLGIDPQATSDHLSIALAALISDQSLRMEHWRLVAALVRAQGADRTAVLLIKALKHWDFQTRMQALSDLLVHCPSAKGTRAAMIEILNGRDPMMCEQAAFYFLKSEPGMAARAIDALAKQIMSPQEGNYLAWDLVKRTKDASPGSLEPLASILLERLSRAPEPAVREFIITALGEIGPDAAEAAAVLLELSNEKDLDTAMRAVEVLAKIDPKSAATKLPALVEWMRPGHDSKVRLRAIAALRDMGSAATSALPALLGIADEEDLAISAGAIEAICRIDPVTGRTLKQSVERGEIGSDDRAASAVSEAP